MSSKKEITTTIMPMVAPLLKPSVSPDSFDGSEETTIVKFKKYFVVTIDDADLIVGECVGGIIGDTDGRVVGECVGLEIGDADGVFVGDCDGGASGAFDGEIVGENDGILSVFIMRAWLFVKALLLTDLHHLIETQGDNRAE